MDIIFDFEIEDSNVMRKCIECEYGLVKHYKTFSRKSTITIVGICDQCKTAYQTSEKYYSLNTLKFAGC